MLYKATFFVAVHSMTWNTIAFQKTDAATGTEASGRIANVLWWAMLSRKLRGERTGKDRHSGFSSSPPHPLRSPVPGFCGCSPWEERLPRSYLTPGSLLLGCDGTPEVFRSERGYCTSLGLCSNWTLCWLVVGHPKHLPFAAFLTVLGCYRAL